MPDVAFRKRVLATFGRGTLITFTAFMAGTDNWIGGICRNGLDKPVAAGLLP